MLKYVQMFLDRLALRVIVIASRLVASSVNALHATQQAADQSRLEDQAREYEADGKLEIAATLRQRAAQLTSACPADEAMETFQSIVDQGQALASLPDVDTPNADQSRPLALPDAKKAKPKRPRRKKAKPPQIKKDHAPALDDSMPWTSEDKQ